MFLIVKNIPNIVFAISPVGYYAMILINWNIEAFQSILNYFNSYSY